MLDDLNFGGKNMFRCSADTDQNKSDEFVKKNLSKQRMSNLKVVKSKNSIDERGFNQEKKYKLAISANVIVLKVRYL